MTILHLDTHSRSDEPRCASVDLVNNEILFTDGTSSGIEKHGDLLCGSWDGYPFLVSEEFLCVSARQAIEKSKKDYKIPGWWTDQLAFSVLPLFIQNHRCNLCPSINRIVKVVQVYWSQQDTAEATPQFRRVVSAFISKFYNTKIRVGGGLNGFDATLRHAEVQGDGLVLECDNQRDMEVEIHCRGFSLSASNVHLEEGVSHFVKGLLCPRTKARRTSPILWRSSSKFSQSPVKFCTAGNRLVVVTTTSLSISTSRQEEARYHLEELLSYERQVSSPEEFEQLLGDVRERLTNPDQTLEQGLCGAAESIPEIRSLTIRNMMIAELRKLDRPTLMAPRAVRDAICLRVLEVNPSPTWCQDSSTELVLLLQQNKAALIHALEDRWSNVKSTGNTDFTHVPKGIQEFMLCAFALLQYYVPCKSRQEENKNLSFSFMVLDDGVSLHSPFAEPRAFEWSALNQYLRQGGMTNLLGHTFTHLPNILNKIPSFEGLCEKSFFSPQEGLYPGRVMSDDDLCILSVRYNSGDLSKAYRPLPPSNYVLIREMRPYKVEKDWIYQSRNDPFTLYTCSSNLSVYSIKIAVYELNY